MAYYNSRNKLVHLAPNTQALFLNNNKKLSSSVINVLGTNNRLTNLEYINGKIKGKINGTSFTIRRLGEVYGNKYEKNPKRMKRFNNTYYPNGTPLQPGNFISTNTGSIIREAGIGFNINKRLNTGRINRNAVVNLAKNIVSIIARPKYRKMNKQRQNNSIGVHLKSVGRQSRPGSARNRALGIGLIRKTIKNKGYSNNNFKISRYLPNHGVKHKLGFSH
jgi:hypothetical protein